jgi:glycosyltransferase involved in cell wall biosynthesis
LIVSAYAEPHVGGVEVVVAQQARTLVDLGYQVTVITSRCGGGAARERLDGFEIVRVPAWNVLEERKAVAFPLWSPSALRRLALAVKDADIVHVHDVYPISSVFAAALAARARRPLFVTQHVAIVSHDNGLVERVQRACYATIAPFLWRRASSVTVYNTIVEQFLIDHRVPREKIRLTYNGVDIARFRPGTPEGTRSTRLRHGLDPDRPLILFAGRLVPKKGVRHLVAAASPRYQVALAGPGPVPDTAPAGVTFLGPVSRDELVALYQASDIFAFPAVGEMLTLVMQEAMACGLPVVTTDDPAYAGYGLDPRGVALISPDPQALRRTFLELLADEDRLAYMRDYSRQLAQERFDWHRNAAGLAAEYHAALAPHLPRPAPAPAPG